MKLRFDLAQKKVFKNEVMEFDDEGFLLSNSLFFPMKKRHYNEDQYEVLIIKKNTHH